MDSRTLPRGHDSAAHRSANTDQAAKAVRHWPMVKALRSQSDRRNTVRSGGENPVAPNSLAGYWFQCHNKAEQRTFKTVQRSSDPSRWVLPKTTQFEEDYGMGLFMTHTEYYALLSIVFMTSFVLLFDRMHFKTGNTRFCKKGLLDEQDIGRLRRIWSACQEN